MTAVPVWQATTAGRHETESLEKKRFESKNMTFGPFATLRSATPSTASANSKSAGFGDINNGPTNKGSQ